jgi:hypothetical protein
VRSIAAISVCTVLFASGACSSFGETDGPVADGGGIDGAGPGAESGTLSEAGSPETGPACQTLLSDDFTTQRTEWTLTGENQQFDVKSLVLTNGAPSKNGAVWWNVPFTIDGHLRVTVAFEVHTPLGNKGSGLAISWIDANQPFPPALGGLGQAFVVCSSNPPTYGYAVAASTSYDSIAVLDTVACNVATPADRARAALEGTHTFKFDIRPSTIAGSLDGALNFSRTNIVPPAPKRGYLGLTASSDGSVSSAHVIKSVLVESCPN